MDTENGSFTVACISDGKGDDTAADPLSAGDALSLRDVVIVVAASPLEVPFTGLLPSLLLAAGVAAPRAFLAFRIARWYFDRATDSCSFVSISVSMVFSSGGGFSTAM